MILENIIKTTEETMPENEVIPSGAAFEMVPPAQAETTVIRPGMELKMILPEQTETMTTDSIGKMSDGSKSRFCDSKTTEAAKASVINPGLALEMVLPENTETISAETAEKALGEIIRNSAEKNTETVADSVPKKDEIVNIAFASVVDDEDLNVEYTVKFSKKYMFEGEIISEIDLSGLEDLGYAELQEIEKIYKRIATRYTSTPDLTDEYALAAAAIVTGKPIEFFTHISAKDIRRIRNCVIGFFYISD